MRGITIDENTLFSVSFCLLIIVCAMLTEGLLGDWFAVWKDLLFGGVVLVGSLIAFGVYAVINTVLKREKEMVEPTEERVEEEQIKGISRKESFHANVVVMAHPVRCIHDFAVLPYFETERIIASGQYRLELVRSRNGDPTLIVCED